MAEKKEKAPRYTSPKGIAVWPRLTEPDTKFNKDGEYSSKLALDPSDKGVPEFLKMLDKLADEGVAKAKEENPKVAKKITRGDPYTEDDEEYPGKVLVNFKMKASGVSKKTGKPWTRKPAIFDAFGRPVQKKDLNIGGGSVLKVSFETFSYYVASSKQAGVSLRLQAVQVIELVEWTGGGNAEFYGFESEDTGFSVSETDDTERDGFGAGDSEDDAEDAADF